MFSHIQLTPEGKFLRKIPAGELIAWDANNYCTAFALEKDGKSEQFNILPYYTSGEPAHDPITQAVREIDPAQINGLWTQQWEVVPRFTEYTDEQGVAHTVAEQVAAATAAAKAAKTKTLQDSIVAATQTRLDDFARVRNYDGILSLCTYATSTVLKFKTEGQYGVDARDTTWARLYEIMAEVETGTRPMPTSFADIEPELPALVWPTIN